MIQTAMFYYISCIIGKYCLWTSQADQLITQIVTVILKLNQHFELQMQCIQCSWVLTEDTDWRNRQTAYHYTE